jgi:hypothetical protein
MPSGRSHAHSTTVAPAAKQPGPVDLLVALQGACEREREARDRLIQARDELNDRDERFAALEAELWQRCEDHERRARAEVGRYERESAHLRQETIRLREEAIRLRVRLDRIHCSPPMRVYARLNRLPLMRYIAARRTRKYEATVRVRLRA